jgi:hypothetical protein
MSLGTLAGPFTPESSTDERLRLEGVPTSLSVPPETKGWGVLVTLTAVLVAPLIRSVVVARQ